MLKKILNKKTNCEDITNIILQYKNYMELTELYNYNIHYIDYLFFKFTEGNLYYTILRHNNTLLKLKMHVEAFAYYIYSSYENINNNGNKWEYYINYLKMIEIVLDSDLLNNYLIKRLMILYSKNKNAEYEILHYWKYIPDFLTDIHHVDKYSIVKKKLYYSIFKYYIY